MSIPNETGGSGQILLMVLRTSRLAGVRSPTLWRRIDVACNRRRHPADAEAGKDQQDGLRALPASDCQVQDEHHRPGDGQANAVDPIVSVSKHLVPPFPS